MADLLTSIRKPHTDNIFNGAKGIEWRKCAMPTGTHYCYESKTGGGIGKGSQLFVEGMAAGLDSMLLASIDKVDMVTIKDIDLYVAQKTNIGTLRMEDGTTLYGCGAIQTVDVECLGYGTIVTFPTGVTKDADGYITAMKPALTITGKLDVVYDTLEEDTWVTDYGLLDLELGQIFTVETETDESGAVTARTADVICYESADFTDKLIADNKAILAKAPNVTTENLTSLTPYCPNYKIKLNF